MKKVLSSIIITLSFQVYAYTNATVGYGGELFCDRILELEFYDTFSKFCTSHDKWTGTDICIELGASQDNESTLSYKNFCHSEDRSDVGTIWGTGQ